MNRKDPTIEELARMLRVLDEEEQRALGKYGTRPCVYVGYIGPKLTDLCVRVRWFNRKTEQTEEFGTTFGPSGPRSFRGKVRYAVDYFMGELIKKNQ